MLEIGKKMAITGHRPDKLDGDYSLTSPLIKKIEAKLQALIDKHKPSIIISGLALGIDTVWAKLAIKNNLYLLAAVPFIGQETKWPFASRQVYQELIDYANKNGRVVVVCEGGYAPWKMQKRNIFMVDELIGQDDKLIAVWDQVPSGGTYNCIEYARKIGKEPLIIDVSPNSDVYKSS